MSAEQFSEVVRWTKFGFICLLLLTAFIYGVIWLPGPDADPSCGGGVQSVHNGPGSYHKTVVCRDGHYHLLHE